MSTDDRRPASAAQGATTVVVLALPNVIALDVTTICHVLGPDVASATTPATRVVVCGEASGPVATGSGFGLQVSAGIEALAEADLVVVAGTLPADPPIGPAVLTALLVSHRRGVPIVAIGTAAFVLARAGLLDGRRATTHWCHADALASAYPQVTVESHETAVQDGYLWTSAGIDAAVDVCQERVRLRRTPPPAGGATQPPHPGDDRVIVPRRVGSATVIGPAGGLADIRDWMLTNLDQPTSVDELAGRAFMSRRQFTRTFRAEAGVSPWQWLLSRRLEQARYLLETTDEQIELIARRCGFPTPLAFRTRFKPEFGTSPSRYRSRFRATAGLAAELVDAAAARVVRAGPVGPPPIA
jgi:AraC family transcriptional activator FtrA